MGLFKKHKSGGNESTEASSLLDEKQKADIIINNIDDGVVLISPDGVIQVFNPGAARMTGWAIEEAKGLDYRSILTFIDQKNLPIDELQHPLQKVLRTAKPLRDNTATISSKNKTAISIDISATPLVDSSGKVTGVVGILRNVNEQRREEKQRADFISTASHEMRTPVAAIEGYLALALNDKVTKIDSKARSYLEKAHSSTQHLGKLFQDLLTSAKAEDGRLTNNPVVMEFGDFIENLVDTLRFTAEKKGLLLELLMGSQKRTDATTVDVSEKVIKPLLYVLADPDRLREVVTNLFDNAVKYTESGRISIGITGNKSVVQFHISDTGPGIPENDVPHLFQKFYRVDNSSTRTIGGTGLGLYISRKIIEIYNGRIWVESEVGNGSTFYINLPRIDSVKATEMMKSEKNQQPLIQNEKL